MTAPADPPSAAQLPVPVAVELPITLGQVVKLAGMVATGGDAKRLIAAGQVLVNGQTERRRGHKLGFGDVVESQRVTVEVVASGAGPGPETTRQGLPEDSEPGRSRPRREDPACSSGD